jgi:diphthine synthase
MLYLISLGISKEDINLGAIESVKNCDEVYLEGYTSLGITLVELNNIFNKRIDIVERDFVENFDVNKAKDNNIAILFYGDVFSATTHISLYLDAIKNKIDIKIVHNVSILTLVSNIGLSLYNFGKVISIPFQKNVNLIDGLNENLKLGLHTLFLLDLNPKENKFLSINEALKRLKEQGMKGRLVVGIEKLGYGNQKIKVGNSDDLIKFKFNEFPQCLVVPGKMHFLEEEVLGIYK